MEENVMRLLGEAHGKLMEAMKLTEDDLVRKKLKKLVGEIEGCQFGLTYKNGLDYEVKVNGEGRYYCDEGR